MRVLVALDDERVWKVAGQEDEGAGAAFEVLVAGPNRNRPSSTQNDSSSRWWTWSGGPEPAGMNVSTSPNAPPVVSAVALTVIRFGWNHVVSPSPGAENDAGTSSAFIE